MDLYNGFIDGILGSTQGCPFFPYDPAEVCRRTDSGTLILSKEAAFELGGMGLPAVSSTLFCTGRDVNDGVILLGKDIGELTADAPYARAAIISLDEKVSEDDDSVYKQLKDIEFAKYHVYPEGCLVRLSPESRREQIRVSKKAVQSGLSLKNIGFTFIEEYKKNPAVRSVTVVFVTDPSFDYKKLKADSDKAQDVTESLNKILDGLEISCDTCELKAICDEVEGLRQLHFGKDK